MRHPGKATVSALVLMLFVDLATAQSPDFLKPQQRGPFEVNGLFYLDVGGWKDPVNIVGYQVPTIDQIIPEIKATGTNLVKVAPSAGQVKNYTDNAYDPAVPFGQDFNDVLAFGHKLTAQGIPCYMQPFVHVANAIAGASSSSTAQPTDRRAFISQHIPRLVSLAQLAESMGCEYFQIFGDEIEHLAADPSLTDLWIQAITEVRKVFSGKVNTESSWGEHGGSYTFLFPPQLISMVDVFGIGFFPAYTDHSDPTVDELVASFEKNSTGRNSLQSVRDMHTLYGKPILIADEAYGSFTGSNVMSDSVLFGQNPRTQFTVDYQEQLNLYQAFFQAIPTLDPAWMLGSIFDSFDRLPYAWKDANLPPYMGSLGESIRGKPALQTLTQVYQASQALRTPANGWWVSTTSPGRFYAVEAANGIVHLGSLAYSTAGDPEWSLTRCVQTAPGTYAGTAEKYTGGRALNQERTSPPTSVVDGAAVKIVFNTATTATLQIGAENITIQRYQFSNQWASPMLNAARSGWWDQPGQSGRGYFFEVQGNTLLLGGLIYRASGQPSWFTSTGPVDSKGTFSGELTVCSASRSQVPVCEATADTIQVVFSAPWRAMLTLAAEPAVEIRRYRQTEIGWAGPAPSLPLPKPEMSGQSATVNAASFALGVTPGAVATISGTGLTRGVSGVVEASTSPLPLSVHGTSVLVNGVPAPILSVANINGQEQINFQVPWEVVGKPIPENPLLPFSNWIVTDKPAVSVIVVNNGSVSPAMRAFFYDSQPWIITTDGLHPVATHADYSLVTPKSPARTGEAITLYGVGFGPVSPAVATGTRAGSSPPSRMKTTPVIGMSGKNATLLFAELTPGSVGLYQFNVMVPEGLGSGDLPAVINTGSEITNVLSIPTQGQPGVTTDLIRNGSFENPPNDWFLYANTAEGMSGIAERTLETAHDGKYSVHVSVTVASKVQDLQIFQRNIAVVKGATYLLQFWARASNARSLRVNVQKGGGDFHSFGLGAAFTLSPDWRLYTAVFQSTESASDAQVDFYYGDQAGDAWLDSVSLLPLTSGSIP